MNIFDLQATISLNGDSFMSGIQEAQSAFQGLGSGISAGAVALGTAVGNMATKAAGAIVDFGKNSIESGMSFESGMSQIAATLGYTMSDIENNVNGAGDSFDALKAKAAEMGRATNFTATQAAEGLNILAMSGFDAEHSIAMVEDVLHLAAAGGMDMASAAGYISGTMKGFADETKTSGFYADLMAKGATLANTSVSQLGDAMSAGAAGAAAYSQSAESMTVSLLRLAEQGVVGAAAGTALSAAMKNIYTPKTGDAAKKLEELGVSAYTASGRARDFNTVINELEAAMAGMDEQTRNETKSLIFGIQGLDAYNKMTVTGQQKQTEWSQALSQATYNVFDLSDAMTNAGVVIGNTNVEMVDMADEMLFNWERMGGDAEKFAEEMKEYLHWEYDVDTEDAELAVATFVESIKTQTGEAAKQYETMTSNLQGARDMFGSALEGFQNAVYEKLSGPLTEATNIATNALSAITEGFEQGGLRGAIESLGSYAKETLSGIWENLKLPPEIEGIKSVFENIISAAEPFVSMMKDTLADAMGEIAGNIRGFFESFAGVDASKISELAGAIQPLLAAFIEGVADRIRLIATAVQAFIAAFKDSSIGGTISTIAKGVAEFAGAFTEKLADIMSGVAQATADFVAGFLQSGAVEAIVGVAEAAAQLFGTFVDSLGGIILKIADAIKQFLESFNGTEAGMVIGDIATGFANLASAFLKITGDIISKIADAIGNFIDAFKDSGAVEAIGEAAISLGELVKPFTEKLATVIQAVGEKFGELIEWIGQFAASAAADVPEIVDAIGGALESLGPMFDAIWNALQPLFEFLGGAFSASLKATGEVFANVWKVAKDAAVLCFETIQNLAIAVTAALQGDFETAGAAIGTIFMGLVGFAQSAWEGIKGVFSGIGSFFSEIASQAVAGFKNGLSGLVDAAKGAMSGAVDSIKNFLGIGSPSKLFKKYGTFVVEGFEVGWEKEWNAMDDIAQDSFNSLAGTAKLGFENSAIGKSSAAGISSMLAASEFGGGRSGEPVEINLVLDGDVAATALYDPLRRVAWQKGRGEEVAYA